MSIIKESRTAKDGSSCMISFPHPPAISATLHKVSTQGYTYGFKDRIHRGN